MCPTNKRLQKKHTQFPIKKKNKNKIETKQRNMNK